MDYVQNENNLTIFDTKTNIEYCQWNSFDFALYINGLSGKNEKIHRH